MQPVYSEFRIGNKQIAIGKYEKSICLLKAKLPGVIGLSAVRELTNNMPPADSVFLTFESETHRDKVYEALLND